MYAQKTLWTMRPVSRPDGRWTAPEKIPCLIRKSQEQRARCKQGLPFFISPSLFSSTAMKKKNWKYRGQEKKSIRQAQAERGAWRAPYRRCRCRIRRWARRWRRRCRRRARTWWACRGSPSPLRRSPPRRRPSRPNQLRQQDARLPRKKLLLAEKPRLNC